VPVTVDDATLARLGAEVGELPLARQRRFIADYGMTVKDCEVILADRRTSKLYDEAASLGAEPKMLTKQFVGIWNHIASARNVSIGALNVNASTIHEMVTLVMTGAVGATSAMQIAERLVTEGGNPLEIARASGLIQVRDESSMTTWVDQAFAENPQAVADALGDNPKKAKAAPGFLRGQVMKISQGKADPKLIGELIEKKIGAIIDAIRNRD
jgi:aspartyl-tRNA(Asn)/glutamyl-tRNA(Gln) amidotransferase subunit B